MTEMLFLFCFVYAALIGWYAFGVGRVEETPAAGYPPETRFSVVIPFRNEAERLPALLDSLTQLRYPVDLFEVLFVDDASDDESADVIRLRQLPLRYNILDNVRRTASPKKDAITTAISQSRMDWIITTDADCEVPELWLLEFDNFIRKYRAEMVAGPVMYKGNNSFLHRFQRLEMTALQAATIGGFGWRRPFLCNGANLAYKKDLFTAVSGFDGTGATASGDDVLLLHQAVSRRHRVLFLKSEKAVVTTAPARSWREWFQQRVRWAAKSSGYRNATATVTALVVFAGNLSMCLALMLVIGKGLLHQTLDGLLLGGIGCKFLFDGWLIGTTYRFYGISTRSYVVMAVAYPFASTLVALRSLFGGYDWKGRRFSR